MIHSLILSGLVLVTGIAARPLDDSCGRFFSPGAGLDMCNSVTKSIEAQAATCTGGTNTAYNESCWRQLNIGQYVTQWH